MEKKVKKWGSSLVITLKKSEGFKEDDTVQIINKEVRINIDTMFKDIRDLKEDIEEIKETVNKASGAYS